MHIMTESMKILSVYFTEPTSMNNALSLFCQAQGYDHRLEQYEQVTDLSPSLLGQRFLVRHVLTKVNLELSIMSKSALENQDQAQQYFEIVGALQKLRKVKNLATLIDCFSDELAYYCVQFAIGKHNLTSVVRELYPNGCSLSFAKRTIAGIGSVIEKMHKRGIMHRKINEGVIGMRLCKGISASASSSCSSYKVGIIGGLDHVFALKPRTKVIQHFEDMHRAMQAPEVLAGEAHDRSSDVWMLGQLAYRLLSPPRDNTSQPAILVEDESEPDWLPCVPKMVKFIIFAMVKPKPKDRPTISQVLAHQWFTKSSD